MTIVDLQTIEVFKTLRSLRPLKTLRPLKNSRPLTINEFKLGFCNLKVFQTQFLTFLSQLVSDTPTPRDAIASKNCDSKASFPTENPLLLGTCLSERLVGK